MDICGGPGILTIFQGWSNAKFEKYEIDTETYDHTDFNSRPAILIGSYWSGRYLYLTVIYVWDKKANYLLSSRHNPLRFGKGDINLGGGEEYISSLSPYKSRRFKNHPPNTSGIKEIIKYVVDLVGYKVTSGSTDTVSDRSVRSENV